MVWTRFVDALLGRKPVSGDARPAIQLNGPGAGARVAAPRLPRFRGEAGDLERPLRSRDGGLDPSRLRLQRAFTPSQPVSDIRMFAGRRDLLLSLIRSIEEQQLHAVIFGDRGIGKTSLLHVFAQLAREARYIVRYTSCTEGSDFDSTFRAIAADVPLLYHADFDPTSEPAERGGALDELLPAGPLDVARITEVFAKLAGTRVLIVLDEFDRATSADFKRSVAELIKSLSDRSIRVQLVIAGVAANLTELIEHIPSIRRNIIGLPVPIMTADEMDEMIALGAAAGEIAFAPGAQAAIVDAAQGSPYLTGLLAQQAASRALDRKRREVETDDVADAVQHVLRTTWIRLSVESQQQVAAAQARLSAADLGQIGARGLNRFGVVLTEHDATSSLNDSIRIVSELNILRPTNIGELAGHRFADDGVALYLWLWSRTQANPP